MNQRLPCHNCRRSNPTTSCSAISTTTLSHHREVRMVHHPHLSSSTTACTLPRQPPRHFSKKDMMSWSPTSRPTWTIPMRSQRLTSTTTRLLSRRALWHLGPQGGRRLEEMVLPSHGENFPTAFLRGRRKFRRTTGGASRHTTRRN